VCSVQVSVIVLWKSTVKHMERISAKLLFNTELILYRSRVHDDVIMCS